MQLQQPQLQPHTQKQRQRLMQQQPQQLTPPQLPLPVPTVPASAARPELRRLRRDSQSWMHNAEGRTVGAKLKIGWERGSLSAVEIGSRLDAIEASLSVVGEQAIKWITNPNDFRNK